MMRTQPTQHGRRARLAAAGLAVATAAGGTIAFATAAQAGNPPAGPGNIEVFPARDMVAIEGYSAQAGQTATITVTRGGATVGTATGVVDETGFMEWNHEATPNGDGTFTGCFTDVTPDLQANDEVSVKFSGSPLVDGMRVSSAEVTDVTASDPVDGNTNSVTITGTYGPDVDLDRFAVEVVNPAMRDEGSIGERAIQWEPNVPPEATQGYTVEGSAADGRFSVTFGGLSQTDQQLVFEGEKVALSWMADATTVEAQLGLTLAEHGLVGGGVPGCPPGPGGAEPPVSDYSVVWNPEGTAATVNWNAAAPVAGAAAVDGYSVVAIDQATQRQEGFRTDGTATQVVVDELTADSLYDIEVRSIVDGEMGAPFRLAGTITPPDPNAPADPDADTTAPVVTETPELSDTATVETATVTLETDEGTLYYTTDGSAVTTQPGGNVPSATATLYTGPITVTAADTTVNYVAIDAAGNATHGSGVVSPKPAAAAVAPGGLALTSFAGAGPDPANPQGRASLAWNPVTDATEYRVRVYLRTDATNSNVLQAERDVVVTGTTADVTGLPKSEPGQRWVFRVQSKTPASTAWSAQSLGVNLILPGDDVGLDLAQYRTGDEFRISGSGTVPGATITVHRPNTAGTGPAATPIAGYPSATVGALEAPENTGPWSIVMDPPPATPPTTIWIKSNQGAVAGPFTVEVR